MKKRATLLLFLLLILLSILVINGCSKKADVSKLDTSCKIDSDCKQACPVGCINKNQEYEIPKDLLCERMDCKCIENNCAPVEPSFK